MAEGGRSQSVITSHKDEPIRRSESERTRSERTLVSFESFESTTMLPDCRGWLMETESRKQFWCVAASRMLGLFSSSEADEPIKVLTLTNFQVETFVNDVDTSINGADYSVSIDKHGSSIAASIPRKQEYAIALKPLCKGVEQHLFLVPSEEEHLLWRKALRASCPSKVPTFSRRDKMLKQKKISFEEPCRTDSGLGDDLEPPLDHRKSESGDSKIQEPTSFINGALDYENRSDHVSSRGSSFVSSVATLDDLADSNSTSDSSTSVGNNSAVNISEFDFPDIETSSCGRQSLNDSVFLGMSQELDLNQWSDSKDTDCFTSDGDSLPNSPHPRPTSSSMSSAGDPTDGPCRPPSDQSKTMISKVSKLVQRVAHMRRPRSNSSLTLAQIPDSKMSGPMRKKGKLRWYVLSGTSLYCFKSNSKDEESEVIYDLSSYTVALATEEKEDNRSICVLKLTHSSGKKVLFTINNMETAQLWFKYTQDAIETSTSKSRSDSQRSTSSNPESQGLGRNRLSRQSFEDGYGFFERQSSLRCVKDALQNAVAESPKVTKQDSSSGSSGCNEENREGGSLSDHESVTPPATHWASSEDLSSSVEFTEKKSHPAIRFIMKRSSKSQLLSKRSLRQMPIPAADIVDPTMTGLLSVYVQNKGSWKKYWTVLKDDWLYFYKRPTDSSTSDIIEIPRYTIQRERRMADSAPLTQQRFIFSVTDEDGSDRAILMADTEKDTRAWMNKLKSQAKQRRSTTLDGLNLESGQSSLLHTSDSRSTPKKWQTNQAEIHKQRLLHELVLQQNQGGQQRAADPSKSELENPEVTKKRAEILTKYQKANDNEEEEQVRLMTLLNRRRMSAQVKKDVLERTMASRAKKRMERIGSVEEASMEEQIRTLNARLSGIEAEMHAKSFQKRSRVQALKDKEDLELQLLEQKERLSRYRLKTHDALQSTSDLNSTLDEMDEDTADCGEDSAESPKRRESPSLLEGKDDTTDCRDRSLGEKVSQRLSPSVQRKNADDDSQTDKSPNTRRRRLLPVLPDKAEPKLNSAGGKGDVPGRSSHQQEILSRTWEKSPSVNRKSLSELDYLRQRSLSDVLERKSPSPIHSRKISVEGRLLPHTNNVTTSKLKANHRSDSVPHLPQTSPEVSRGLRTMKHSISSSDMSHAITKSPGQRRGKEHHGTGAQSSPKPRRKISVPIRMPSMDNFFSSSSTKGNKDKMRKISSHSSLSNITRGTHKVLPQNGDTRSLSSSSSSIHLSTPTSSGSPDINGNVHHRGKGHGGQVEEIDPEVLRDIEEFEMMARKALRDAGWTFRL
ncbi:uncharacterized protein LOC117302317 [Asterias rubens]|uniref:uncharacterized protein LOC117302317 n=1 Tax=Asterias rubens TaxID=7604 RepID=UPI001455CAC6|nr:uncharacterized protein LOC117302317 [Asterias rubens]